MVYHRKAYQSGWFGDTPILGNPEKAIFRVTMMQNDDQSWILGCLISQNLDGHSQMMPMFWVFLVGGSRRYLLQQQNCCWFPEVWYNPPRANNYGCSYTILSQQLWLFSPCSRVWLMWLAPRNEGVHSIEMYWISEAEWSISSQIPRVDPGLWPGA